MIKLTMLLALSLLPLTTSAQVYKCEIGGKTSYQDRPCPGRGKPIAADGVTSYQPPSFNDFPSPRRPAKPRSPTPLPRPSEYMSNLERRNAEAKAHADGRLLEGMTKGKAYMILGEPDTRREYTREDGERCESLSWSNPRFVEGSHSAKICEGKVTSYSRF